MAAWAPPAPPPFLWDHAMKYPLHPACSAWPRMSADELRSLAEDMKANGQLEPATITPDGLLLDGANRQDACAINGSELNVVIHDDDPVTFSLSKNRHRRHMDKVAMAFVCAELAKLRRGGNGNNQHGVKLVNTSFARPSKTIPEIAKAAGIPEYDVSDAKAILDKGTAEIIDLARSKKVGLRATADYVRQTPKDRQVPDPTLIREQRETGKRVSQIAIAFERGRAEGIAEASERAPTEPLPKTAQEKLAVAEKRLRAQLEAEFEQRVRDEVKRRLEARDEEETLAIEQANELLAHSTGRLRPPFTAGEYHQLLWALHPDNRDPAKVVEAFIMVKRKKAILCDEGPIKRKSSLAPLPKTLEELRAMKQKRQA